MWKGRNRKSPRLRGFDYTSSGAYFITIKTAQRQHLFGEIVGGEMRLNELGDIVFWEWHKSEHQREELILDEFVIMPNHVHGLVFIEKPDNANSDSDLVGTQRAASLHHTAGVKPKSLGAFVRAFKSAVTNRIHKLEGMAYLEVWQERYHDQIIKNEQHLNNVRQYIAHNPANWETDEDNQP